MAKGNRQSRRASFTAHPDLPIRYPDKKQIVDESMAKKTLSSVGGKNLPKGKKKLHT